MADLLNYEEALETTAAQIKNSGDVRNAWELGQSQRLATSVTGGIWRKTIMCTKLLFDRRIVIEMLLKVGYHDSAITF